LGLGVGVLGFGFGGLGFGVLAQPPNPQSPIPSFSKIILVNN